MSGYPNREHENADKVARRRALDALSAAEGEIVLLRRRIGQGTVDDDDTQRLSDILRRVTKNIAILQILRDVREWHAADTADREGQS